MSGTSSQSKNTEATRCIWIASQREWFAISGLFAAVIAVFAEVVVRPGEWVVGGSDAAAYFAPVRAFTTREILDGNLPLWNPHLFSGTPHVAAFQSAVFYPLHLHYLILPLAHAMNVEIVAHVLLLGIFMYAWSRNRGISRAGSFFAAAVLMFSGCYYLHVFAGHLAYVNSLAWTPLAFLATEKLLDSGQTRWACIGAITLAMAILAGHPQAAFVLLLALAPYAVCRVCRTQDRVRRAALLAIEFLLPVLLSAAQLWPALAFSDESIRAGGLHFAHGSSASLPPENLLTLIAPGYLGDPVRAEYWGRWGFWEVSCFIGVTGAALAVYGMLAGRSRDRFLWAVFAAIFAILALGRYTPVYHWLYGSLPGFDSFRVPARFFFGTTLFLAILAGQGADAIARGSRRPAWFAMVLLLAGGLLAAAGVAIQWATDAATPSGLWPRLIRSIHVPGEVSWDIARLPLQTSAARASRSLLTAAILCGLLAGLFVLASRWRRGAHAVVLLGLIELLAFGYTFRPATDLVAERDQGLDAYLRAQAGEARILDLERKNYPMEIGALGLWGFESTALLRYVQLIAYTQDTRAEVELTDFSFKWFHPLYRMFRCRYVIQSHRKPEDRILIDNELPRVLLVERYRIVEDREQRYEILADPSFNPRETVVLESEPVPRPLLRESAGAPGWVRAVDESTDRFTVEAELERPALLLITDAYAKDWRARAVGDGPQAHYEILPANHAIRAVPLSAGKHRIGFEYAPPAMAWGIWTSIASCALMTALGVRIIRKRIPNRSSGMPMRRRH